MMLNCTFCHSIKAHRMCPLLIIFLISIFEIPHISICPLFSKNPKIVSHHHYHDDQVGVEDVGMVEASSCFQLQPTRQLHLEPGAREKVTISFLLPQREVHARLFLACQSSAASSSARGIISHPLFFLRTLGTTAIH
ncbi:hypothetical protein L1887_06110 [Cichorium endivia]|nr:hypothetical protein L1887_06110 [Cichorium endivia]